MNSAPLPVVALTLGDPAGIGPELIARLLAKPDTVRLANVVVIGDPWLWADGQRIAGVQVGTQALPDLAAVRRRADSSQPAFVALATVEPQQVERGKAAAAGGASVLKVLDTCMDAAQRGEIDAICFAPLNKYAMKLGGLRHEDELHHFAEYLGVKGYFCEFNTLGDLWTSRVSSHIPLKDAAELPDAGIASSDATRLIYRSLQASGVDAAAASRWPPSIRTAATAAPAAARRSTIIEPAVAELNAEGAGGRRQVDGPFPADTIFLKARDGAYEAIVTMYHEPSRRRGARRGWPGASAPSSGSRVSAFTSFSTTLERTCVTPDSLKIVSCRKVS